MDGYRAAGLAYHSKGVRAIGWQLVIISIQPYNYEAVGIVNARQWQQGSYSRNQLEKSKNKYKQA